MTQTTATSPYRSLDDAHGNNELLDMLLAKGPRTTQLWPARWKWRRP
ncbi:hypothetical protein [Janthinobacterium sp. LB2P70]